MKLTPTMREKLEGIQTSTDATGAHLILGRETSQLKALLAAEWIETCDHPKVSSPAVRITPAGRLALRNAAR